MLKLLNVDLKHTFFLNVIIIDMYTALKRQLDAFYTNTYTYTYLLIFIGDEL